MSVLLMILLSTLLIASCVWVSVIFLFFNHHFLEKIVNFLVSLSAGVLMGGAFLHLLPEAAEKIEIETLFVLFLISFAGFFLTEKLLFWRHCHHDDCEVHSFGYMNIIGDAIHNFIDGVVIASAFMVGGGLGFATVLAIAAHEIPQEIGDFGVMVHAGFSRKKALILNFLVALTVVVGGLAGYYFFSFFDGVIAYILPIAAGGFVYIAASDLIPELRGEKNVKKSAAIYLVFVAGIIFMYLAKSFDH